MNMPLHRALIASLAALALAAPGLAQYTTVSKSTAGALPDAHAGDQQMSGDGRYVVFATTAATLVAGDTNGFYDVYVRDTVAGITERISNGLAGAEPDNDSRWPAISEDGRYVAFASAATNLVVGDTNLTSDVFLVDRTLGTTTRVSVTYLGGEQDSGHWDKRMLDVSDDGRYVAFTSQADNLVSQFTAGATRNVFLRDVVAGTTTLVSIETGDWQSDGGWHPSIDDGGDLVAFTSNSHLLHPADTDSNDDIFIWHRVTEAIELVTVTPGGLGVSGNSEEPRITPDGRYVVFESTATDIDPLDTWVDRDIYLRDRTLGTSEVVSLAWDGTAGPYTEGFSPDVSADGRYVVFHANRELTRVEHSPWGFFFVYLRDRVAGTTEYITIPRPWWSVSVLGGQGAHVSDDGTMVVYQSEAPPQEDPAGPLGVHANVELRERNGSSNLMSATSYNGISPGQTLPLTGYDAPASSLYLVAWSLNTDGFTFRGHEFDLGLPIEILGFGFSDGDGKISYTSLPIPALASGLTIHVELVGLSGGVYSDSNYAQIEIY